MAKASKKTGRNSKSAQSAAQGHGSRNPYGGGPNTGITLPPYYRPTPSVKNANTFFPGVETLGDDEMRISFVGSSPVPPTRAQAATSIMVELGNGKRFFFDLGPGCLRNIVGLQVPLQTVNDIFITHLHVDHYGELPYIYAFSAWSGRWKPLRVTGPSGRTPKDGTKAMIGGMKAMTHWHTDSFNLFPIGDGFEVEVNEFDHKDDNGICYEKDGVVIRHWRRIHGKDGASAYRLDWNGLSFVWTGDGRPDSNTVKYSQGADVFVTEMQPDTMNVQTLKFGMPIEVLTPTVDVAHTVHYATGYMFNEVQPRLAMATHLSYDDEQVPEMVAGIRTHWDGLFQFGAPDGVIVNVTKDAIWTRKAAIPDSTNFARPSKAEAMEVFGIGPGKTVIEFPAPKRVLSDIEDPATRALEIDAKKYYPPELYRKPNPSFPKGFKIDIKKMAMAQIEKKLQTKFRDMAEKMKGKNPIVQMGQQLGNALESAESPEDVMGVLRNFGQEALLQAAGVLKDGKSLAGILKNAQKFGDALKQLQGMAHLLQQVKATKTANAIGQAKALSAPRKATAAKRVAANKPPARVKRTAPAAVTKRAAAGKRRAK